MLIVGLTGGIGSGKSTVSRLFAEHGVTVIDADVISHELTAPGGATLGRIRSIFGNDVITTEGTLDRAKVRERVFAEPKLRRKLEGVLHPLVRKAMLKRISEPNAPGCALSLPSHIEATVPVLVGQVLSVDADVSTRMRRVEERSGLNETAIRRIMPAQINDEARRSRADDIIRNDDDLTHLEAQVAELHRLYLGLSQP